VRWLDQLIDMLGGCPVTIECRHAIAPVRCERNKGHVGPHTATCTDGRAPHVWIEADDAKA
jgi:hypothetical protein